jgi:hypothetical protein
MNTKTKHVSGYATSIAFIFSSFADAYKSVMTIEHSPLKNFDPIVAHMMFQVLAFVWSGIFAMMLGSYFAFGISAALHVLFLSGVFITAIVFKEGELAAARRGTSYRMIKYNSRMPGGEHE